MKKAKTMGLKPPKKSSVAHYQILQQKEEESEEIETFWQWDFLETTLFILKVVLWFLLMALSVHFGFGAVFFIISAFYIMFTNFRKSKKSPDELSAYSVFNPNCETIKGTLTAQQMENELKFGIGGLN